MSYIFRNALFNAGYLFNHIIFTRSYFWYRLTKRLSAPLLRVPFFAATPFMSGRHVGSIQGFRHSANSYATTLVTSPGAVHSHVHWIWGLTDTIKAGVVPLVLVRSPHDVLVSTVRRYRAGRYAGPYRLMPLVCLIAWHRYYSRVFRHLDQVCLVDFERLTCPDCYGSTKAHIEQRTTLKLASEPSFARVNPGVQADEPERFSFATRAMLAASTRLHAKLLRQALPATKRAAKPKAGCRHRCGAHRR